MKYFSEPEQFIRSEVENLGMPAELCDILGKLTHQRRGWLKRDVNEEGTVEFALQHTAKAVHAAEALNGDKWKVDKNIVKAQVLVHELPEIEVMDYMPGEISEAELRKKEWEAMEKVFPEDFPERDNIVKIWHEFDQRITREARMAYALDKLDAYVSSEYYALVNPAFRSVADEFFDSCSNAIGNPELLNIMIEVRKKSRNSIKNLGLNNPFIFYYYLLGK